MLTLAEAKESIIDVGAIYSMFEGATLGLLGEDGFKHGVQIGATQTMLGVAYIHAYKITDELMETTYEQDLVEYQKSNAVFYAALLRRIFYLSALPHLTDFSEKTVDLMLDEHEKQLPPDECLITNHIQSVLCEASMQFVESDIYLELTDNGDVVEELSATVFGRVYLHCAEFVKGLGKPIAVDYANAEELENHLIHLFHTKTPIFAKVGEPLQG